MRCALKKRRKVGDEALDLYRIHMMRGRDGRWQYGKRSQQQVDIYIFCSFAARDFARIGNALAQ